jgi:hypothetical protein
MKKHSVLLLFLLFSAITISTLAYSNPTTLPDSYAPVVLTGSQLADLLGTATEEIFVYAFTSGTPAQIPFQLDEQNAAGMFIPHGDGLLDETEELVFMASDAGEYEPDPLLPTPGGDIYPNLIVTLSDPISNEQAWAYIYTSPDLMPTFAEDYVSYDAGNDRVTSPGLYSVGYNATNSFRDYLTLGGGADVLDRDKVRLDGTYIIFPFSLTENNFTKDGVHALDGPVRVTRVATSTITIGASDITSSGASFFYGPLISQPLNLTTPASPTVIDNLRNSTDFNAAATGMTYYDPNNTEGKTIDGTPDTLAIVPAAEWQQVSGADGTMLTMVDLPDSLAGMSTYYKDDSATDPDDTGDQKSYGDSGFQIANPPQNQSFELLIQTVFLSGNQPNVGATYFNAYLNPLDVQVDAFGIPTLTPTETSTTTPVTPTLTPVPPTLTPTPIPPTLTPTPPSGLAPAVFMPLLMKGK